MNLKKKIISILTAALVVGVMAFNVSMNTNSNEQQMSQTTLKNIEALTASASEVDPECPNGCLDEAGSGCYCYQWYPYVKEADWD